MCMPQILNEGGTYIRTSTGMTQSLFYTHIFFYELAQQTHNEHLKREHTSMWGEVKMQSCLGNWVHLKLLTTVFHTHSISSANQQHNSTGGSGGITVKIWHFEFLVRVSPVSGSSFTFPQFHPMHQTRMCTTASFRGDVRHSVLGT